MLIGYARVSTYDQNLNLQRDALKKEGCEKIYTDKITGKTLDHTLMWCDPPQDHPPLTNCPERLATFGVDNRV